MLQTLGLPRDPDSTGSSTGSKSVERCEGMVSVAEDADAEEIEVEAVVADVEVVEAELAEAEVAEADAVEAGLSSKCKNTTTNGKHMGVYRDRDSWILRSLSFLDDHITRVPSRQSCNVSTLPQGFGMISLMMYAQLNLSPYSEKS